MIDGHLEGAAALHRKLKTLELKAAKKVARGATTAAARVQRKTAKAVAPRDSGAMKKSQTVRVKQYPSSGVFVGIVGPRKGAEYEVSVDTGMGWKATKTAIPGRYVHLLEFGHRIVVGGTLSHAQSKAGGGRRTTRRSEEHKRAEGRSGSKRRRTGVATAAQKRRTGAGRVVGRAQGVAFLKKAGKKSRRGALARFISNMDEGITRHWNAA